MIECFSIKINVTDPELKDLLTAYAFEINCQGSEDLDESYFLEPDSIRQSGLKLYFDSNDDPQQVIELLKDYLASLECDIPAKVTFEIEEIEKQNWREKWKENYHPILAGNFVVLPVWLQETASQYLQQPILIEPKMAFGTGTHETTQLMLEMISKLDVKNKIILDAGSGSGILAIACLKAGALRVEANDVEQESIDNSLENVQLNGVCNFSISLVDENSYTKQEQYDLVLANIHRTVLCELLIELKKVCKRGGIIALSGILVDEQNLIYDKAAELTGLEPADYAAKNEWCTIVFQKK